ncbi:MAG: peptide chain release factor 3 [Pseudomonadota bacterium]|nr:MAG: peptide chain release factor 3 [Pseudomonadota bacterium]
MDASTKIAEEARRRRTFAIISHPDAGKTTTTEKILLYSGAIHLAGSVKARRARRHAVSDWMAIEKERGISVTSSVLAFEYEGLRINLLDTPGHQDFGEDTYRTLMAADAAIMLLDNAKGVEPQTKKLFHVCRLRRMPIVTLINKCDREGKDPLELLSEVQDVLGIEPVALDWPIGSGRDFVGVYDRMDGKVHLFEGGDHGQRVVDEEVLDLGDPAVAARLGESRLEKLREDLELLEGAGEAFDRERFLLGEQTPVFFASAATNFGIGPFLRRFVHLAPPPGARETRDGRGRRPEEEPFSAFVFKIQANMDPGHRDRLCFLRVCSGRFEKGMTVQHLRLGKEMKLSMAHTASGREREEVEEAYAGDIIGVVDTKHQLRIGDTLASDGERPFLGVPRFSPEIFATLRLEDPMRRKQLVTGLTQLAEEGAVQIFLRKGQGAVDPIVAVVGPLQLDVLEHRLKVEYGVEVKVDRLGLSHARWIGGDDPEANARKIVGQLVQDTEGHPVVLFRNDWELGMAERENPDIPLLTTSPLDVAGSVQAVR